MSDKSWKGEHFIRARCPSPVDELRAHSHGGSMMARPHRAPHLKPPPVEKPSRRQVCAVPLCGRVLAERNRSGLCKAHNHHQGLCQCHACIRRRKRDGGQGRAQPS